MKAKIVNEDINFEKEQDPKKSMNIGIKDFYGYVDKRCEKEGLNPDDFWNEWFVRMQESSAFDIAESSLTILEHTPLQYQIDWIDEDLEDWLNFKKE